VGGRTKGRRSALLAELLDDLVHVHVLEDAEAAAVTEVGEPRLEAHCDRDLGLRYILARGCNVGEDPMEYPLDRAIERNRERRLLAERIFNLADGFQVDAQVIATSKSCESCSTDRNAATR